MSPEELEVLKNLITRELETINPEIHHTGSAAMRDELKEKRNVLQQLLARLSGVQA
jgi:hypothetical protein